MTGLDLPEERFFIATLVLHMGTSCMKTTAFGWIYGTRYISFERSG